ncbi:uncharacterized protein LOC105248381 isoform X2 [Camponotus floridanus]|uniref:uncharacterized protein LOC105248381 isoform X2 n=1 Tax=Camponotus floridanus TaxID=104421 RepID=UPI000DC6A882|nr:uncharacterized protein LOC105248381 isoform X2 [Camponotus floridanus]
MSSSSKKFCSLKDIEKRNSEPTTNEKEEMQEYEKRILQCILAEKIIPTDLKHWSFFHFLKTEFIQQIHMVIVCNNDSKAIIVTKDKNVYNLDNEKKYVKTGNVRIASYAKKIKELCGKNIQTFAHNRDFVLALTEEGELYIYKFTKKKRRGSYLEQSDVPTFTRITGLKDKRIVDIACGSYHFLALTSSGKVYAWEDVIYMQQGNENTAIFDGSVRQIKHGLEKKNVVYIACGHKFNMVITDENKLYGWGKNDKFRISPDFYRTQEEYYTKYPHEITTFSDKIVKMVCGFSHMLALTDKGKIYGWGSKEQVGINNYFESSGSIVLNVPQMGKVLNIDAYGNMSVAVGYDRTIYVWGWYFCQDITQPRPTKFSRIFDVFMHSAWSLNKPLIMHDSLHTVRITNNYNYKYTEVLSIFESLKAAFDDPLTSDLTVQVDGRPIYVHKTILKIRCQYFRNMFQHNWIENIQSISVYTVSDKFSYVIYKAFLKYLYTGIIDLPAENVLELMELADMYCETNLKEDCNQIIKQTITVSNVAFFYNKAIEYNAKELEEFCLQFAFRHMTLSKDYNKLDMSILAKCTQRAAIDNDAIITSSTFCSLNKNVKNRNLETSTKKYEMLKCEKRILQCLLAEKLTSMDLKRWPFFHLLKSEFISEIHMIMRYNFHGTRAIIVTKDKNVYNFDHKTKYLKTGRSYIAYYLNEIKELCGKNIKTFAQRYSFILALTEEGEVYFSEIANKCSNSKTSDVFTFIRVVDLSDKHIVDIGCGQDHDLALTSDGKVYEWGKKNWEEEYSKQRYFDDSDWKENYDSEENNSQDDNKNAAYFSVPWQVKHELEKKKVVLIVCGLTFNIVVTDENRIYGWGDNKRGQISIVRQQKYYKRPREIIKISDKIVKIVCGRAHVLALTNKGEVYAWGDNRRGQVRVNKNRISGPTVVNVPEMGKVLDIAACDDYSVAVGYDKIIYLWGSYYWNKITIPFPTKFSNIHDVFAHNICSHYLIVLTNNFKYVKEVLNILESLKAIFDDPLTSDLTIRVEERPIYVHKTILKIRCLYFKSMFRHNWKENIQNISVHTVSDKFSYVTYKAFLKYLYTGIIDLPAENVLELMELADMYCEINLLKDCSQKIIKVITVSNVMFFYNKAIEFNAKELKEFCFHFALRHMEAVVLSEDFIKLDTSTKDNFMRRAAEGNTFGISFF